MDLMTVTPSMLITYIVKTPMVVFPMTTSRTIQFRKVFCGLLGK